MASCWPPSLKNFRKRLGWTVDPVNHPGFKGKHHHLVTDEFPIVQHSPLIVQTHIPCSYSIHILHEAAFLTPVTCSSAWSNSNSSVRSVDSLDSGGNINCAYSCMHAFLSCLTIKRMGNPQTSNSGTHQTTVTNWHIAQCLHTPSQAMPAIRAFPWNAAIMLRSTACTIGFFHHQSFIINIS